MWHSLSCRLLESKPNYCLSGCYWRRYLKGSAYVILACQSPVLKWSEPQPHKNKNSVNICPASFCTPRPNLSVILGISWRPTSAFQSPMMKRPSFSCLLQEILWFFMEFFYCSLFGISDSGMDLDYCDSEWFALKMNWYHSVILEITLKYCILYCEGYSISSKGFLPKVVDRLVIWIKFAHSHSCPFYFTYSCDVDVYFCYLFDHIQFTLIHGTNVPGFYAISFFTTLDFTFTTRQTHTEHHFCLGSSASLLLELLVISFCSSSI